VLVAGSVICSIVAFTVPTSLAVVWAVLPTASGAWTSPGSPSEPESPLFAGVAALAAVGELSVAGVASVAAVGALSVGWVAALPLAVAVGGALLVSAESSSPPPPQAASDNAIHATAIARRIEWLPSFPKH
jgi:hypothetical protein